MNSPGKKGFVPLDLPRATVKHRRSRVPVVWAVPLVALLVVGYLVYEHLYQLGPAIVIKFKDGSGLKAGKAVLQYRGVRVGEVTAIELGDGLGDVAVRVRLQRSAAAIAREGSVFWIVRPEVGVANITGLGTVIQGSYIEVLPGEGKPRTEFVGHEGTPVAPAVKGLRLILTASQLGSLGPNSPVYYRGVQVGTVQTAELAADAAAVHIRIVIQERYARLVRGDSRFWNVSGTDVEFGFFSGLKINVESLRSLAAGGVAFATPSSSGTRPVKDDTVFALHNEAKKEWRQWAPRISVPTEK